MLRWLKAIVELFTSMLAWHFVAPPQNQSHCHLVDVKTFLVLYESHIFVSVIHLTLSAILDEALNSHLYVDKLLGKFKSGQDSNEQDNVNNVCTV